MAFKKYWHPEKHKHAQRILASEPTSEPTAEGVEERMGHIVARSVAGYRDVLVISKRLDLYMLQLDVVFQRIRIDQIDVFYLNTENKLYKLQLQADGTFAKTLHGREGIFTDDLDQEWNDSANY